MSTAITKLNYSDIPMLVKFLYEKYGIETYNLIFTHIIGLAKENKYSLSIRYSDAMPYIKKTADFIAQKNILPISPIFSNVPPKDVPCLKKYLI